MKLNPQDIVYEQYREFGWEFSHRTDTGAIAMRRYEHICDARLLLEECEIYPNGQSVLTHSTDHAK